MTEITRNQNFLLGELDIDFKNSSDLNTCINNICSILNDCVLPYMDVKVSKAQHTIHKNNACGNMKQDKPWFDETCKNLKEYKGLLHIYNNEKSYENKETLLVAKKKYQKYRKKSKYKYKQYEGDMFDFLRKHNPKHFYSLFSKGKSKSGKCSLTNDDFQAYFKRLIEGNSVDHTESTCDFVNYNAVYEDYQ